MCCHLNCQTKYFCMHVKYSGKCPLYFLILMNWVFRVYTIRCSGCHYQLVLQYYTNEYIQLCVFLSYTISTG